MNTYKIAVLGASGAGKTVFLASMFNKLSTQREDVRFFLTVPADGRKVLVDTFQKIADTSAGWPAGTKVADVGRWTFTCRVRAENGDIYSAFNFDYVDYAGGIITDLLQEGEEDIQKGLEDEFDTAHALLAILDGHKIYALLKNAPPPGGRSIFYDLGNILPIIEKNKSPIHFIITKWDLLDGEYSLKDVRDRLMSNDQFNQFVQGRKNVTIRLIPVSSVGMEFAKLRAEGNNILMEKVPGADPKPFQVEMPISCVLPDALKHAIERLKEEEAKLRGSEITVNPNLSFWDQLMRSVGKGIEYIKRQLPPELDFAEPLLRMMAEYSESSAQAKEQDAKARTEIMRRRRDESLKRVSSEQTAVEHAINSFMYLVDSLERKFPDSKLSA